MDKAIIVGAGTYGEVYSEYLAESKQYNLIGYVDDDVSKRGTLVNGSIVLGDINYLASLENKYDISIFVPIGNNLVRSKILDFSRKLGFKTPGYIHKSCNVHNTAIIGESVYILPSTNIMPFVQLEDDVMISMGVNIAHHSIIGKSTFISQGSNIGASIKVGPSSFVGIASTIMTGVKIIGENVTIGAGAVVIHDVPPNVILAGVPAKIIRTK